jgi:hypothetical protein
MNDDTMRATPRDDRTDGLRAGPPVQESEQPDLALQTTSRVGAAGWAILAVVVVFIITVVLYGLNGPSETSAPKAGAAAGGSAERVGAKRRAGTDADRAGKRARRQAVIAARLAGASYSNAGSTGTR